jgi:hypothetical protein
MKKSVKFTQLILLSMIFVSEAGSYFTTTLQGMGVRRYLPSIRGIGMGITGIASADSIFLNNYGVSQWRHIGDSRLSIGLRYNRIYTEINSENFLSSTAGFTGIGLAVPLQKDSWVIGINFQPYSSVEFKSFQDIESDGVSFTQNNILNGTIAKAQLNLVWSPLPSIGVSINGNYYLGIIEDRYEYTFNDGSFRDVSHSVEYRIGGPGIGFSADVSPWQWLMLAGFADFKASLNVEANYTSPALFPDSIERNLDSFPLHLGIGSSILLGQRWNLAIDYSYQNWTRTLKTPSIEYDEWYHLGLGFERKALNKRKISVFNQVDFRGGLSATQIGYKFNNESVMEYAAHLGFGIPFNQYRNRFDFAFSAGVRGDQNKNLVQETFINFHASIAIGERWFQSNR